MCDGDDIKNILCKFCLSIIISVVIIILHIIFSFKYVKYDFENYQIFNEIQKNLDGRLIYSFRRSPFCNGDEEKLILGIWDGTREGCYCDNILDKTCSDTLLNEGCKTIPSNDPMEFMIINSNFICVKKSTLSYKDLLISDQVIEKDQNCPQNYKSCGKIDTLDRKFCVKMEEPCPINKIDIENNKYDSNENFFYLSSNYKFYYSNNDTDGQILSIFKLSQNYPCINPAERYWDYYYILEQKNKRCTTELKNIIYDNRFELISNFTTKMYQLYLENSILGKLRYIEEIDLNKIKNDNVYFYGRNFIGFNKDKIKKSAFKYDELLEQQNSSNKYYNIIWFSSFAIYGLLAISLIYLIIILIGLEEFSIKALTLKCGQSSEENKNLLIPIIFIVGIIFVFVSFILNSGIIYYYNDIKSILNFEGSDEFLNELIDILFQKYSKNYGYAVAIVVLFCVDFFFGIFSTCCYCSGACD